MGQRLHATAITVFCLILISEARADPFTFSEITVPGSINTEAFGINDSGEIVGAALFNVPNSNGQTETKGFVDNGGAFSTFSGPGSSDTRSLGVNNSGEIAGYYMESFGGTAPTTGFLFNGGTLTTLPMDIARGINASGQIIGSIGSGSYLDNGGTLTPITIPGFTGINYAALGINNHGEIVGYYVDPTTSLAYGFLDHGGIFTTINDPDGSDTTAWGINNNGEIVGTFFDAATQAYEGFLDSAESFTTIDNVPGAISTTITGINDSGEMVGIYSDCCSGEEHAFLETPVAETPLPATLPLFASGLGALGLLGWRRKRKAA